MDINDTLTTIRQNILEGIITVEKPRKAFVPQDKLVLVGNPARKLSPRDRARLLKVINQTRTGKAHFTVEVTYDKQTDAAPRIQGQDFQAPTGISTKVHVGLVVKAALSKEGHFYITVKDSLRENRGQAGFTAMRLEGLRSFKILTEDAGPLGTGA